MVKITKVLIGGMIEENMVSEEDYLKVVMEKEYLNIENMEMIQCIEGKQRTIECLHEITEKMEKELKEKENDLKTLGEICNEQRLELEKWESDSEEYVKAQIEIKKKYEDKLKEKDEEMGILYSESMSMIQVIEKLKNDNKHLEETIKELRMEETEELWTLRYVFEKSEEAILKEKRKNRPEFPISKYKEVVQIGMLKEDAEELIGMDSDNWIKYSLEKEVR